MALNLEYRIAKHIDYTQVCILMQKPILDSIFWSFHTFFVHPCAPAPPREPTP